MPSATVNVMEAAARKAARGLIRDFGEAENLQVSGKGPDGLVAEAVRRAGRILRAELARARPGFGFLMEATGQAPGEDPDRCWAAAPLDGRANFLHGVPHFAVSIALVEAGEPVAGAVYEPLRDELFWAEKGAGCYVNRRRLRVSSRRALAGAMLAAGLPARGGRGRDDSLVGLASALEAGAQTRLPGAPALDLAYVAAGRHDGFWAPALAPWQAAAGIVLVREAGGFATDLAGGGVSLGGAGGAVAAANDRLHAPLLRMLRASG